MKNLIYLVIFIPFLLSAQQGQKMVSGTVTDADMNMPIPGASVYISSSMVGSKAKEKGVLEGAMLGTTTDFDGNFELEISDDIKTVMVSYMGYKTKTVDISGPSTGLNIVLEASTENLDEVLITGYQKIEKRKTTSAYAAIEVSEIKQAGVPR